MSSIYSGLTLYSRVVEAALLSWFHEHGRDLPWRRTRDPYAILVSEVMLQQTQVDRVVPRYREWLARWPTADALAAAPLADVIQAWQGLGYNRRALALRQTAQAVVDRGGWPDTVEGLAALPGVGPYTARAVACFALEQPVAPVDTNVARVLARSLAATDPAHLTPAARQRLADQARPPPAGSAWAWSSALMDVGALHCRPRPRCDGCPLELTCRWRALGAAAPPPRRRAQAPFASSDRRWRGAVVRALAAAPDGLERAALADQVQVAAADRPAGWFDTLLARLESEGMVATGADGRLRLPA